MRRRAINREMKHHQWHGLALRCPPSPPPPPSCDKESTKSTPEGDDEDLTDVHHQHWLTSMIIGHGGTFLTTHTTYPLLAPLSEIVPPLPFPFLPLSPSQ